MMRFTKLFSSVRLSQRVKDVGAKCYCCAAGKERPKVQAGSETTTVDASKKGLVVGVYVDNNKLELTPAAKEIDQKSGGKIMKHLDEAKCNLKLGKAVVVTDPTAEYSAVAVGVLGPKDPGLDELEALDVTKENVRWAVGAGVRQLQARCCGNIVVEADVCPRAAAEGAHLAAWRFQEFKTGGRFPGAKLSPLKAAKEWGEGAILAEGQNWARFLADMPANLMTPVDLAQAAIDVLCPLGVKVDARDRLWIEAQNMQAFMAVARGACSEPMFLECSYMQGDATQPPVLIAAKGVTFDSGGLCLKPCTGMVENRGSMAGAAVALGAIKAIAQAKLPLNVRAVIPICENMISGQCMKVGDVVRALNGLSIQIEHTDMEGRLMMADALVYGQAAYKPALVLDVATLTKGVALATGGGAFGCFTTSEAAWSSVRSAGAEAGDRGWRFPVWNYYDRQITNEAAVDLRNQGSGHASACIGAAFLKHFVCCPWIHLDITGVGKLAHIESPPYLRVGRMTGRPTRTLAMLLQQLASHCAKDHEEKQHKKPH